ncbi:helix-turn-helix domain-containing protein [Pantoea agglomerans]|uniref:helix-turn-helix domain-containing protein n=1 Tax=Enterobacter agglomerans TaxID=549 RepID=UPI002413A2D2|nr:XRE family transcriptional regulator [Pantoea agglomerans]
MRQTNDNTLSYLTNNIPGYMLKNMKTTNLAERLKQAMDARNMSQASLAEAAGISQPSVWKIISGRTQSSKKLVEIASALKVRPEWLLNGSGEMNYSNPSHSVQEYGDKAERGVKEFDDREYGFVTIHDDKGATSDKILVPDEVFGSGQVVAYKLKYPSGFIDIPQGSIIVVNTEEKPGNEDFVYVNVNKTPGVYKYLSKGVAGYLDSGDSRIPLLEVTDETKIVGVIVFLSRFFRK